MEFVAVKRKIQELGKDDDGRKLTMLGQVYGYNEMQGPGGIAVLQIEGEQKLVFLEVNAMTHDYKELPESDQELLLELWEGAEAAELLTKDPSGPTQ